MTFDEKVTEDADYRYEWLQVSTTIPKQPGQRLDDSYYSQKEVSTINQIIIMLMTYCSKM